MWVGCGGLGSKDRGQVPCLRGLSALQQESKKGGGAENGFRESKNSTPDTNMTIEASKREPWDFSQIKRSGCLRQGDPALTLLSSQECIPTARDRVMLRNGVCNWAARCPHCLI